MKSQAKSIFSILFQGKASIKLFPATILSLAFAISVILSTLGLMDGFESILKKGLNKASGDLIITSDKGFFQFSPDVHQWLSRFNPYAMTQILQAEGFLITEEESLGVLFRGVDTASFGVTTGLNVDISDNRIAIGKALAKEFSLQVGDELTLAFPKGQIGLADLPQLRSFVIDQIVSHEIYEKDKRFIYINKTNLENIMELDGFSNMILIKLTKTTLESSDLETIKNKMEFSRPAGWNLKPYWSEFSSLLEAVKIEKISITIILQLIVIVAVFNITAILIFISERKSKEIFLLQALGLSGKSLSRFWLQTTLIIWGASCLISIVLTKLFNIALLYLPWFQLPGDIYVLNQLQLHLGIIDYLFVFGLAFIWVMLLGLLVFNRTKKRSILSGLRQEFR
jgi:ABC-type lipoprotein release transport system permease subunit